LADVGVAVTVLPATDLYLMGRDQDHNVRRGVADANFLVAHGVNCSLSSNNVLNPATPYGDCSLIRMAYMHAYLLQLRIHTGRSERLAHAVRIARDDGKVRARGLIRFNSPLFPITQGADRNTVSRRKVFLAQTESATDDFRAGGTLHPDEVFFAERLRVRVTD